MKILIAGASGLIGRELRAQAARLGHQVFTLVRQEEFTSSTAFYWNPVKTICELPEDFFPDIVVNLCGEGIADRRWSPQRKRTLWNSRIQSTTTLSRALAVRETKPRALINASAIGFYGDRQSEILTEESSEGRGFLAELCAKWESSTQVAEAAGIRVVHARLGIVLAKNGGALKKMLLPFRLGLGGVIGSGRQWMSVISLADLISALLFVANESSLSGAVNFVAPSPVTNRTFTKTLGRILRRPTFCSVPQFAISLLFGEMGEQLLLASTRVTPSKLLKAGFKFEHPELENALRASVF